MYLVKVEKVNGEIKYDILGKVLIGEIDFEHDDLPGAGMNAHIDIDAHIADEDVHFTQSQINHNNILNNGVYSHLIIDAHLYDAFKHVPDGYATGLYLTYENGALVWKSIPAISNDVDVNTQTLSADLTLSFLSPKLHYLGATGQKVILPTLNADEHKEFVLFCTSGNFRIQNTSSIVVDTVYEGSYKSYVWTGTKWKGTSVGSTIDALSTNLIIGKGAKAVNGLAIGEGASSTDGIALGNSAKNIDKSEAFGSGQAIHFNTIAHHGAISTNKSEEIRNIHQGNGAELASASELIWYVVSEGNDEAELLLAGTDNLVLVPYSMGVMAYRVTVIGRRNNANQFCRFEFDLTVSRFTGSKIMMPDTATQISPIHENGAPDAYVIMWDKSVSADDFGIRVCARVDGEWTWTCRMTGLHHEVNG